MADATGADLTRTHLTGADLTHEIEAFLYREADLLDSWKLTEWLELFTEDAWYLIPSPDAPDAEDPKSTLFLLADDHIRLAGRVSRLESQSAFVERPRSRTRHLVTNVQVEELDDGEICARSNFAVYRTRRGVVDNFVGRYRHRLVRIEDGTYKIKERRATLDVDFLRPQGKVSFIL